MQLVIVQGKLHQVRGVHQVDSNWHVGQITYYGNLKTIRIPSSAGAKARPRPKRQTRSQPMAQSVAGSNRSQLKERDTNCMCLPRHLQFVSVPSQNGQKHTRTHDPCK